MGPRSYERGNDEHALWPLVHCIASMGPRSYERGNVSVIGMAYHPYVASMGPRSYERGNDRLVEQALESAKLQWGRVLTNAETPTLPH